MTSNLGPIAAALISWIVFNTIGKPLLRFFDLRTEVRRTMILYDNVRRVGGNTTTSAFWPRATRT